MQERVFLSFNRLPTFAVITSHFQNLLFLVGKHRGCYHHHSHLPGLEIFEMSESHSRAIFHCDHCGIEIIRHNLRVHTKRHYPGSVVKERIWRQLPVSGFFTSKKAKINDILETYLKHFGCRA